MTSLRLLAATVLAFTAACSEEAIPTIDSADAQATIVALEKEWMLALQSGDIDAAMAFVASDPLIIVPNAAPIVGREAFRGVVTTMIEDEFEYSWEPVHAIVSPSQDMAYDYGRSFVRRPDGTVLEGNYMVVWVREGGAWKVAVDMVN